MPVWTGLGADNNWSTALNWDTGVPTAATPAIFNGVGISGNKNVTITAGATCSLINFTGYSGQLNMATTLTVAGAVTLSSTMTSTGTANISKTGSGTMTSNTHVFSGGILMSAGALTLTWADNWDILNYSGTLFGFTTWSGAFIVSVRADAVVRGILSVTGNITTLRMSGTGLLNSISNGGNPLASSPGVNINIDTSGTITLAGTANISNSTFTYTQGTFNPAAVTFNFGLGTTFDTDRTGSGGGKITFNNVTRTSGGSGNITLTTDLWMNGSLGNTSGATTIIGTGRTIYVGTNLTSGFSGDITIELNTSTNGSIITGGHGTNIVINKTGGASVSLGTLTFGTANRTLTYTNGVINPLTSTVTISANITINGWTFWNLTIGNGFTITQNIQNIIQSVLTCNGSVTFAGTFGWTCSTLTCSLASSTIILQAGITYTTTTNVTMLGTNAGRILMRSSAPTTTYAIWTLQNPASQSMVYVSATAIDSSLGMTIYSFGGIISTAAPVPTLNWALGASQGTKAFTFVS